MIRKILAKFKKFIKELSWFFLFRLFSQAGFTCLLHGLTSYTEKHRSLCFHRSQCFLTVYPSQSGFINPQSGFTDFASLVLGACYTISLVILKNTNHCVSTDLSVFWLYTRHKVASSIHKVASQILQVWF